MRKSYNYITVATALNIYYQGNKITILDNQELIKLEDKLSPYGTSDLLDMYRKALQQENMEEEELAQEQKNPEPNSKKLKSEQFDKKSEKEEESEDENRNRPFFS